MDRRMELEKWREEKEKKRKEALLQKKKPFIVGVAHNALKFVHPLPPKAMPSTSGRVTRSQSAEISNKAMPSTSGRVTRSQSAEISNNVSKQKITKETKQLRNDQYYIFAPKNAMFNPVLNNLPKPTLEAPKKTEKKKNAIENTIKDKARSKPKSVPKQYEPRNLRSRRDHTIIKSRRDVSLVKLSSASCVDSNPSKESLILKVETPTKSKQNNKFSTPKNTIPKSESSAEERLRSPKAIEMLMTPQQIAEEAKKTSSCATLSKGKDNARREMKNKLKEGLLDDEVFQMESVKNFRRQVDSEIKRMAEMCDTWEKISKQIPLPEAVQEAVLSAIGQARLLMSQKLQQFVSLLLRCGCPEPGQPLVTLGDLHGFWAMVYMQIMNIDMRFKKLEELRARGWAEEEPAEVRKKPTVRPRGNRNIPAASSRLRDMIAAARKAKKYQLTGQSGDQGGNSPEYKTFDAGFFHIQSPVMSMSPKPSTSGTQPSLPNCPVEAKRASVSKDAPPLTPINLSATPARSILNSNVKSSKKSIKVVQFDISNQDLQETLNKDCKKLNAQNIDDNLKADLSSMDTENKENKSRRKQKLVRQDTLEDKDSLCNDKK